MPPNLPPESTPNDGQRVKGAPTGGFFLEGREDLRWPGAGETDRRGRRHGTWTFHFESAAAQLTYRHGKLDGPYTFWSPEGIAEVGHLRGARKHGTVWYFRDQSALRVDKWRRGVREGWAWLLDPALGYTEAFQYLKGKRTGPVWLLRDGPIAFRARRLSAVIAVRP